MVKNLIFALLSLFLIYLVLACNPSSKTEMQKSTYNTTESKVPTFELPALLTSKAGKKISTKEAWETTRRPELIKTFADEMFGNVPENSIQVSTAEKIVNPNALVC